jgi:ribose transport system substrate-binding protein
MIKQHSRGGWRTLGLVAIPIAAMTLAACGSSTSSESSSAASSAAATEAASEAASEAPAEEPTEAMEPKTIGFVFNTSTDPNQQTMFEGIRAAAEAQGWEVKQVDPNNDAAKANNLMTAYVSQGVDVIVTTVFPPSALRQGIAAADEAGIPVVATYAFGSEPGVEAVFAAGAGKQQTERMIADMGGTGSVLAFTFKPGQPCVEAEKAFDEVLAANPDVEVQKQEVPAPGWEQTGLQTTSAWLKSHPEGSGNLAIWGCWDGPNLGAIKALEQAGRTDVKVYGQYGEAGAINAVKDGNYTATYWFDNAEAGKQVVSTIGEILQAGEAWEAEEILFTAVEVDANTIEQFLADHPAAAGS